MQERIGIPAYNIQLARHNAVIEALIHMHEISGNRNLWCGVLKKSNLGLHKVGRIPCGKTLPLKIKPHYAVLAALKRRLDLVKTVIAVAPESRPPCGIELLYVVVEFVGKIGLETLDTERTVALAAEFVGNMPHDESRMG